MWSSLETKTAAFEPSNLDLKSPPCLTFLKMDVCGFLQKEKSSDSPSPIQISDQQKVILQILIKMERETKSFFVIFLAHKKKLCF